MVIEPSKRQRIPWAPKALQVHESSARGTRDIEDQGVVGCRRMACPLVLNRARLQWALGVLSSWRNRPIVKNLTFLFALVIFASPVNAILRNAPGR
jgi:hypothetical protein